MNSRTIDEQVVGPGGVALHICADLFVQFLFRKLMKTASYIHVVFIDTALIWPRID